MSTSTISDEPTVSAGRPHRRTGFTLLEMAAALAIVGLAFAGFSATFSSYRATVNAKRAAEVFARDMAAGRSFSVRARQPVSVRFDEAGLGYVVVSSSGDSIVMRSFTPGADLMLDTIDLQTTGDSIYFDSRGRIDFSGIGSSLGTAVFVSRSKRYQVRFNLLGASRVSIP